MVPALLGPGALQSVDPLSTIPKTQSSTKAIEPPKNHKSDVAMNMHIRSSRMSGCATALQTLPIATRTLSGVSACAGTGEDNIMMTSSVAGETTILSRFFHIIRLRALTLDRTGASSLRILTNTGKVKQLQQSLSWQGLGS